MSIAKRIFELQQIEVAIQTAHEQLERIRKDIEYNDALEQARRSFDNARLMLSELEKQYRDLDAEAEELRKNIKGIEDKLYGGKVKNPKELIGYEQEERVLKTKLDKMDDTLIDLMERIEAGKTDTTKLKKVFEDVQRAWEGEKEVLKQKTREVEEGLTLLEAKCEGVLSEIDEGSLSLYKEIKRRGGQAVVKVEQGRCMGCHCFLSVSELQRVRGNTVVQCSNCGRILYLS